jgi:hypothetical protein
LKKEPLLNPERIRRQWIETHDEASGLNLALGQYASSSATLES